MTAVLLTCIPDVHTLAEVQVLEVCERHQLGQACVCDSAGNQAVVATQCELLQHWQVTQVTQLGRADVLQRIKYTNTCVSRVSTEQATAYKTLWRGI